MALQFFNKSRKISEALEGLSEAARQKKENVEDAFEDAAKRGRKEFKKVRRAAEGAVKNADREVHSNPWAYIGAAAAVALLVGFAMGRATRKETWER